MLWVRYCSNDAINFQSLGFLKRQYSLIKSIGDNVFPLVGLVDLRVNSVLVYYAATMGGAHDCRITPDSRLSDSVVFSTLLLQNADRLPRFNERVTAEVSEVQDTSSGSETSGQRTDSPTSNSGGGLTNQSSTSTSRTGESGSSDQSTPSTDPSNSNGDRSPPNGSRENRRASPESPSGSESESEDDGYPFECKAEFIGVDGQAQSVFIQLLLRCETWRRSQRRGRRSRTGCRMSAEMFEVGIVAGDEFSTFLKVEQVQLDMGPSVEDFPAELESRRNACLKGVSIGDQTPRQTDMNPIPTRTSEKGIESGASFPWGISLKGNWKGGKSYTFPAQSVGLDLSRIQIGPWKSNHHLWCYPIAKAAEPFKEGPLDRNAKFCNHSGNFFYLLDNPPSSLNLELAINYWIPGHNVFLQNDSKKHPCRSLLFKLKVRVLPNHISQFIYPRDDSSGIFLDLGTFRFTRDADGHPVLHISHDDIEAETFETRIRDPHLDGVLSDQTHGTSWRTQKIEAGIYKAEESDVDAGVCSAGGEINMSVGKWT